MELTPPHFAKISNDKVDIRVTDLGPRQLPSRFHTVVHHSGLEWRTESKCSSVTGDIVEWSTPIPM